jgi:hypothetical protein
MTTEASSERGPVRVDVVVHDGKKRGGGPLASLKAALIVGLAGAALLATAGTFLGQALVTWQQASPTLKECRSAVEIGVDAALGDFVLYQLLALGGGFVLAFLVSFYLLTKKKPAA